MERERLCKKRHELNVRTRNRNNCHIWWGPRLMAAHRHSGRITGFWKQVNETKISL